MALVAGDIAIVGYGADTGVKSFAFVVLVDGAGGQTVNFTDNGWLASGSFRSGEGTSSFTIPAGTTAGTVFTISGLTSSLNPSTSGDQILAYTGNAASPTFLFAVDFADGNTTWAGDATSSNTSAVPTGLSAGTTALAFGEDNAAYTGSLTGTRAEILANIANTANWTKNDAAGVTYPSAFTVSGGGGSGDTLSISSVTASLLEGDSGTTLYQFTVTRSGGTGDVVVDFSVAGSGASQASAGDFDGGALPSGSVTITGSNTTATITVAVTGDSTVEPDEQFQVTISTAAAGYTIGTASATATITNDDVSLTRIYDIQGAGHKSSFVGGAVGSFGNSGATRVTTEGVITHISYNGFFIQDATGDGDEETSDGIFVFTSSTPSASLTVGEVVRVTGRVDEFRPGSTDGTNNLTITELNVTQSGSSVVELGTTASVAAVTIGPGGRLPSQTVIDNDSFATFDPTQDAIDFWESLEGMLVEIPSPIVISGTSQFASGSDFNEEIWVVPLGGFDTSSQNARGGLTLGATDTNPERIQIDDTDRAIQFPQVTTGDQLADITGVVHYDFANYEILVETPPIVTTPTTITKEVTSIVAGERQVTIAGFNVENLDPNDSDGDTDVASGKFAAIADQIVDNLKSPTIVALQEVQDNSGSTNDGVTDASTTAATLIAAIVAAGGPAYTFVDVAPANGADGGQPGGNIRTGFLYDAAKVSIVGAATRITDGNTGEVDLYAGDDFASSRKPLVATFASVENGLQFTVINNHWNSKGGDGALFGNQQPPVLTSEAQRTEQAKHVKAYIDTMLTADPDARVVVVGDMNDFAWSTPLTTVTGNGTVLTNLAESRIADPVERYSYNFNGSAQELDHTLVTEGADILVTAFDIVHINAEFSDSDRTSDHDPSLTLLSLRDAAETFTLTSGADTLEGYGGDDVINAGAGNDTISGGAGNDRLNGGSGADAMTGGLGDDRFYVDNAGDTVSEATGEGTDAVYASINFSLVGKQIENLYSTNKSAGLTLTGNDDANRIYGNTSADTLIGGAGNDLLFGLGGADTMSGGLGDDSYYVDNASDVVVELAGEGTDRILTTVDYSLAGLEVENLYSSNTTTGLTLTGNDGANRLFGNVGNDTLIGGAGNDQLFGLGGADTMTGGTGDDSYFVDDAADTVVELAGEGTDRVLSTIDFSLAGLEVENLYANAATGLTLTGNDGANKIYGGAGDDTLVGGAGNDQLFGLGGADSMTGGTGDDTFYVDAVGDTVVELAGEGADRVFTALDFSLVGLEVENLYANAGATGVSLTGNSVANKIYGGAGDDTLTGGLGRDQLTGGDGADTFVYAAAADTGVTSATSDIIVDFDHAEGDQIDLSALLSGSLTYIADEAFSGTAGELRVVATSSGQSVQIDLGGDSIADMIIVVKGGGITDASDFIL